MASACCKRILPTKSGIGDSYVMDPPGKILVQSRRHQEDFITAEIAANHKQDTAWGLSKSAWSLRRSWRRR